MWELADYKNEFNGIKNDINKSNPAKKKTSSFENFDDNEKNYGSVRKRKDVSAPKIPLNYQNSICNQLKISVWNIHGLSDKLGDPDIQNYIKEFHIVAFTETKKSKDYKPSYLGYIAEHFARTNVHEKAKSASAGCLSLIKKEYGKLVEILPHRNEHIILIKIQMVRG